MSVIFTEATKEDIEELIRLRIAYMIDDFGGISDHEKECMEKQLPDYFARQLGNELVAFIAKDDERIVAVAYLHIIEMPASPFVLNGFCGEVLSVYTKPEYRGKGLCTQLMKNLIQYAKSRGLCRVDLSATDEGHPIYKKVGFTDKDNRYTEMRYKF